MNQCIEIAKIIAIAGVFFMMVNYFYSNNRLIGGGDTFLDCYNVKNKYLNIILRIIFWIKIPLFIANIYFFIKKKLCKNKEDCDKYQDYLNKIFMLYWIFTLITFLFFIINYFRENECNINITNIRDSRQLTFFIIYVILEFINLISIPLQRFCKKDICKNNNYLITINMIILFILKLIIKLKFWNFSVEKKVDIV